jgi:hypothetical protein
VRRLIGSLVAISWLLSACSLTPTNPRRPIATKSAKPGTLATPKPGASRKPGVLLAGPTTAVKGHVEIDAHYIIANNAGSLIANNGGSAIALKAGTLISDNGLGIISDNGLGLISDNGLGLISNNGGGIISDNGLGFRILQAAAVELGTVLPVKGMAIIPLSMRTGEVVGKPVFTDAQGAYSIDVPDAVKGNLRLVARVPVAKADDPLATDLSAQYNLVLKSATQDAVIDEDTSVTTKYVRACFAGRLQDLMVAPDADEAAAVLVRSLGFSPSIKDFLSATVVEINTTAKAAKVHEMSDAQAQQVAQRVADVLLSFVDIESLVVDPVKYGKIGPKEPALPGLTDIVRQLRAAATTKMKANPDHFNQQAWVTEAKWNRAIKKPADLSDFVVDNYWLGIDGRMSRTRALFAELGIPEEQAERVNAIAIGILADLGQALLTTPGAKAQVLATIEAAGEK